MLRLRIGAALLAVCALASTSWLVSADDKKPDEKKPDDPPKAKGVLPQNWKAVGLTKDQVTEVYKVQSKFNSEIDKLKAKIDALKAEEKVELEKILTDEQKRKLREIKTGEKPDKDKEALLKATDALKR